ncbi:uncharacterized protein [Argopecten irradians]|uniref:uncharacterized protein n=1 Tax=Argopecten irradians TaxID=31199 RepID=UPI003720C3A0
MDDNKITSRKQRLRRNTLVSLEDRHERKKHRDRDRQKSRICVGQQIGRWMAVKVSIGLAKNEDVAKMLLDSWCLINSFFVDEHGNFPDKDYCPEIQKPSSPHSDDGEMCSKTISPSVEKTSESQNITDSSQTAKDVASDFVMIGVDDLRRKTAEAEGTTDRLSNVKNSDDLLQSEGSTHIEENLATKVIKCEPDTHMYLETERHGVAGGVASFSVDRETERQEMAGEDTLEAERQGVTGEATSYRVDRETERQEMAGEDTLETERQGVTGEATSYRVDRETERQEMAGEDTLETERQGVTGEATSYRVDRETERQEMAGEDTLETERQGLTGEATSYGVDMNCEGEESDSGNDMSDIPYHGNEDESVVHYQSMTLEDNDVVLDLSCSEEDGDSNKLNPHTYTSDNTNLQQSQMIPSKKRKGRKMSTPKCKEKGAIKRKHTSSPIYRQSRRLQKKGRRSYIDDLKETIDAEEDKESWPVDESLQSQEKLQYNYTNVHPKKRHTARFSQTNTCVIPLETVENPSQNKKGHRVRATVQGKGDHTGVPEVPAASSDVFSELQDNDETEEVDLESDFLSEPDPSDSDYDPNVDVQVTPPRKKRKYTKRKKGGKEKLSDDGECVEENDDGLEGRKKSVKKTRTKRKSRAKGEKLNCLPGSRRSDKYFPDINVQLEDHKDKYEITTWTSHCKKDRGVDVEQRSFHGYGCKLCGGVFKTTDRAVMEVHLKEHMQGKLTCGECGLVFSYYTQLRKHRLKLHVEAKYTCEECGQQFHYIKVLHTHLSKVHNKNVYSCKKCQMTFQSNADRKAHSLEVHPECFDKCKVCGETVNITLCKDAMERHMRSYWCQRTATSICEICGKEVQRLSIKTHIRRVHHKTKTLRCDICDFSTHLGSTYRLHMMTHTGEHPVKCSLCDFSCIRSYQLTSHMRTHTGHKPYKCDQCNYASAWNVQLKDHKKAHQSEDRVNCDTCNIMFKDRRGLNMHISKEHANTSVPDSHMVKKKPGSSNNCTESISSADAGSYIVRGHQEAPRGIIPYNVNGNPRSSDSFIVRGNLGVPNSYIRGNLAMPEAYMARGGSLY